MDERNNKLNFRSETNIDYSPEPEYMEPACYPKHHTCVPGKAVTSNVCQCSSMPVYPKHCTKVPVVLGENTVRIHTEADIDLGREDILEIKRIKKNVYLTQCKLLGDCYPCQCDDDSEPIRYTGVVFLEGYVRKNIEYATADSEGRYEEDCICGQIKHQTCYIPFKCSTEVILNRKPVLMENYRTREIEYFDQKCLGQDKKERDFIHSEVFNEPIYCELVEACIYESEILDDECYMDCCPREHTFGSLTEKMVICLTFKLLQNQQMPCPPKPYPPKPCKCRKPYPEKPCHCEKPYPRYEEYYEERGYDDYGRYDDYDNGYEHDPE